MPFGGLVVNRVHAAPSIDGGLPPELAEALGDDLARRVDESAHELAALAARDEAGVERLVAELGSPPAIVVPELDDDVHDVDGLVQVREHLFARLAPRRGAQCSVSAGSGCSAEQLVGDAAQRRLEVPAEHVAQHRAQVRAELGDQLLDVGLGPHEAGDRGALERDRARGCATRRRARSSGAAQIAAIRSAMPS